MKRFFTEHFAPEKCFFLAAFLCFCGVFITGSVLRQTVINISVIAKHSLLLYLGIFLLVVCSVPHTRELFPHRFHPAQLILNSTVAVLCCAIITFGSELPSRYHLAACCVLPVLFLAYRTPDTKQLQTVLSVWMFLFRICVLVMLATAVIDQLTGFAISKAIAQGTGSIALQQQVKLKRCVSYMGHPLFSAELYLGYYLFSRMTAKLQNKEEKLFDFLVPFFGILLTQSRLALVLITFAFLFFHLRWNKKGSIILLTFCATGAAAYFLGVFDRIIARVAISLKKGDITNGRISSLVTLTQNGELQLRLFSGNAIDAAQEAQTALNRAKEFPLFTWCYYFGIAVSAMLCFAYFCYPLFVLAKRRQTELFVSALILAIDVNWYTGLSTYGDKAWIFCVLFCLILNISDYCLAQKQAETAVCLKRTDGNIL